MKQFTIVLFLLSSLCLAAQDIEVKKFGPNEKDHTAVLSPRKDINGVACGLVKVLWDEPGAEFEGNIIGDVQFTGKEYLVYMTDGNAPAKRMGIKHPDYLPTTIVFADYGTKKIESGVTYQLKVKANKKKAKVDNSKKGMAVFNIKPSNAMFLIDGQIADGSGGAYTLSLPFGTHYYTVKIKDFSINNQILHIDKEAKNINVDLTEYFAKLDVTCLTSDAEILVNNQQMGEGRWGSMVVPGSYTIEAQKDGCHPQSRQVVLKDNDVVQVDFPALKTITGSLRVDYEPAGADVLLNGKKVGVTPLVLKELPVGDYQLEIWKKYYVKEFATVRITEDQEWKESGKLKLTYFGNIALQNAGGWLNNETPIDPFPLSLVQYYRTGAASGYRGGHYACEKDTFDVPINPVRGVYWLKKAAASGNTEAKDLLNPYLSLTDNDERISFEMAKKDVEETDEFFRNSAMYVGLPYAALAWHYFYGIGCEKNITEATRLIKLACSDDGFYFYRALKQLIKDMGLQNQLKYLTEEKYENRLSQQ